MQKNLTDTLAAKQYLLMDDHAIPNSKKKPKKTLSDSILNDANASDKSNEEWISEPGSPAYSPKQSKKTIGAPDKEII